MGTQIADPYQGLVSFQQCMQAGILKLDPILNHDNLYSHFDSPAPNVDRLTYVLLHEDSKIVLAFLSCIMNGQIKGSPCVAFGYAVPENLRNQGLAKKIMTLVIQDQVLQAKNSERKVIYIEAVVDVKNIPSQRVAEAVLVVEREIIKDSASGLPAYRYTKRFDTASPLRS